MDESVDAADVDEGAEVGKPPDCAMDGLSDLEAGEYLLFPAAALLFENGAPGKNDPLFVGIDLDRQ